MDDQFMSSGLRKPSPAFTRGLSEKLARLDARPSRPMQSASGGANATIARAQRPALKAAAWAAVALLALSSFALPPVRAAAKAFLDMFRVVSFAPVRVDARRAEELKSNFQLVQLLADDAKVLQQPGPPQTLNSIDAASAAAGMTVREPTWKPVGIERKMIVVNGEVRMQMTTNVEKIRALLEAFRIDDLEVPDDANGKQLTLRVPSSVHIKYGDEKRNVIFMQATAPEVSFPAGLDLAIAAEIALRILGLERAEAHRFAQEVDWRTTLLVPVPADIRIAKQVDIQGNNGMLVERVRDNPNAQSTPQSLVMWSSNGIVYVLSGNLRGTELFEMAQSLQ